MAESRAKKAKIDKQHNSHSEQNNILLKFRNDRLFDEFAEAAHDIDRGDSCMNARFLRIKFADASVCTSFSKAACYTDGYSSPTIALGALFTSGLEVLKRYIETCSEQECLPDDSSSKTALMKLVCFLIEGVPEEFYQPDGFSECDWAVFLTRHVLSKLTLSTDITIDQNYQKDKQHKLSKCTGSRQDELVGEFGDTSFDALLPMIKLDYLVVNDKLHRYQAFSDYSRNKGSTHVVSSTVWLLLKRKNRNGCRHGWHGSVDILIENNLPASVTTRITESVGSDVGDEDDKLSVFSDSGESSASDGVESAKAFVDQDEREMSPQCIVYSFLQAKSDSNLKNHLIPSLGISKRKLKVLFYDCDNDILLTTADLEFTDKTGKFNPVVAILLWLTLNYKIFCTGLPEDVKHCTAKFNEWTGEKIKHYREDVKKSVHIGKREESIQEWAIERGINPRRVFKYPSWKDLN